MSAERWFQYTLATSSEPEEISEAAEVIAKMRVVAT